MVVRHSELGKGCPRLLCRRRNRRSCDERLWVLRMHYPVLQYTPTYITGGIQTPKELLVVGERNWLQGCLENAVIIDSSGHKYHVLSSTRKRWTWNPWNVFPGYRTIWVEIELSEPEKLNLDSVRQELLDHLLAHPKWYRHYHENEESLRMKFNEARTMRELINSISVYP